MRKTRVVLAAVAAFGIAGFVHAQPGHSHQEIVQQYELKDGSTLHIFKDGKMGMEDKKGRALSMKEGRVMVTKDGQKIMMHGNELWAVKAHQRAENAGDTGDAAETPDVHHHTRK